MIKLAMKADAVKSRMEEVHGNRKAFKTNWMHSNEADGTKPNVYEMELPPEFTQALHFHRSDEFQLIIGGSGTISSEGVQAGSIHYASAYSAYGPFSPGLEGVQYLTLRMSPERDFVLVGSHAPEMDGHAQVLKLIQPVDRGDCLHLVSVESSMSSIDGTGALSGYVRVPPNFEFNDLQSRIPGDKFIVVKSGLVTICGHELSQWECVFLTGDEEVFTANSGTDGLELIVLQFSPRVAV